MSFRRTAQIIRDRELRALVDQLAGAPQIESSHIGEGGGPSAVHALFRRVATATSREEALALLQHRSPVVRGYLAGHVLDTFPEETETVSLLLSDHRQVLVMDGCERQLASVAHVVLDAMNKHLGRPGVAQLLLRAALAPGDEDVRAEALQLVAPRHREETSDIARALLKEKGAKLQEGAIRALGLAEDPECAALVRPFATSEYDGVRAAVAAALISLCGEEVEATLLRLIKDRDPYVRMLAGAGYVRQPGRDIKRVRQLLEDRALRVHNYVAVGLAKQPAIPAV